MNSTRLYEEGLADDKDSQDREEEGTLRLLQHCYTANHFIFPSASVAFLSLSHTTLQLVLCVSVCLSLPFACPTSAVTDTVKHSRCA